jgi:hypothetical protein
LKSDWESISIFSFSIEILELYPSAAKQQIIIQIIATTDTIVKETFETKCQYKKQLFLIILLFR